MKNYNPYYKNCAVCGQLIKEGAWVASKPKGRPEVYAHKTCIKSRKERKT